MKKTSNIKQWPREERPRELLLSKGPGAVSDAGLIAILLRSGLPGYNVVKFSRELLVRFGSIGRLLNAEPAKLLKIKGLGLAKVSQLLAAFELVKRLQKEICIEDRAITNSEDVIDYFSLLLKDMRVEVCYLMLLNKRNVVIEAREISRGTIDRAAVYIREIIRSAVFADAKSVILIHNHPSGEAAPSREDIAFTKRVVQACDHLEIGFLDHIIISGCGYFSFKNKGML